MAVAKAWASISGPDLEIVARPLSDGGDGFVDVVRYYRPKVLVIRARVRGPLGRPIDARWGWDPDHATAYLESAAAVGLANLSPAERAPLEADTFGLGQLVACAANLGAFRMVVGLGGSATVDGGFGMARALGYRFEDQRGESIVRTGDLADLERIEPPADRSLIDRLQITALTDVTNPLLGPAGAAPVFGPQKGADQAAIERLEIGLTKLAERWVADLGVAGQASSEPGAGAAGGLGAGCRAFLGAELDLGAAWCARLARLGEALEGTSGVITGEGRFDDQSSGGKVAGYVVAEARRWDIPAVIVCASSTEAEPPPGVTIVAGQSLAGPSNRSESSLVDLIELFRIAVTDLGF